jgi:hypothetical protein
MQMPKQTGSKKTIAKMNRIKNYRKVKGHGFANHNFAKHRGRQFTKLEVA